MKNSNRYTKLISLFVLLLFAISIDAQHLQGYIKDGKTNEPLAGVNIFIDGTTIGTTTNEFGFYLLAVESFPLVFTVSYLGYETRKISITKPSEVEINVLINSIASTLPEAIVRAKPKIDTVYKERYSVIDYEFFDKYILLLVYRGLGKRYSVLLINEDGEELFEEPLEQAVPVGFYKGCLGAIYFLTGSSARQIYIENERIYFYKPVNLNTFERMSYSCILSANDYVYFQNYFTKGQVIQYYRIHKDSTSGTKENFAFVIDKQRAIMADDEFNFQAQKNELEKFALRPIGMGEQLSNASFLSRVVFEPIYAPIFQLQDSLIIFNHRFHQIEFYHQPTEIFKTVDIDYSKDREWKKEIVRDEDTEQFYTISDTRWGYMIHHINVQTGKSKELIELDRAFVSNIKVKGGFLYFLENDFRNNDVISKLQKVRID